MSIRSELSMRIEADADVLHARRRARELASGMRFSGSDLTLIATAVSEIARNVVVHATRGEVLLRAVDDGHRRGLMVIVRDNGPGIADQQTCRGHHPTAADDPKWSFKRSDPPNNGWCRRSKGIRGLRLMRPPAGSRAPALPRASRVSSASFGPLERSVSGRCKVRWSLPDAGGR